MNLSGQQWKQLQEALLDAFPNKSSLEQMLLFGLDKNLDAIAEGGSLENIVFNLIKTSKAQGWLVDLIDAARKENPGNSKLSAIALELLPSEIPPGQFITPYPSASEPQFSSDITEGDFSFQEQITLAHIPAWLSQESFTSILCGELGSVEVKFFVPGCGFTKELLKVKNCVIQPSDFWNEIRPSKEKVAYLRQIILEGV
ncbi:hypothetical protein F7734_45725 [Scytonema sp. UIC 10036]|uniref:effector-associated domain EAD1-containing protein n=1 Tax=Scytonema sp. UIC 10036 TaxID=2304196 RepID=UPI0012DA3AD3|nr:effector-associated domain EAD1-containing protein [Scytonema sp. UIC 10036]MUG99208.1 hypothetical protein [Scytonema sp. UIC 10036]